MLMGTKCKETITRFRVRDYNMMMWIVFLCLLTSTVPRARTLSEDNKAELDAKAGETILIRKWSLNDTTLSIIVKGTNITLLNTIFPGDNEKVQNDRLIPKYNVTSNEASLIFSNVCRDDEGLYQIEESFYRTKTEPHQKFEEKDGRWNFQLNVFEPGDVPRGYVGENVIVKFSKPSKQSFLYHYDKKVAIIHECECRLFPGKQFTGRLRCSRDEFDTTCSIIIQNVTQRDAGLYKVIREDTVIERRFLNITGTTTTNTMNPDTLQARITKPQLHQISAEDNYSQRIPLKPSTLDASSSESQRYAIGSSRSQTSSLSTQMRIPGYVIPVAIGVVGVIMLTIGFLIWMQRRNTYDLDTVQRLILEKCETASFSTPTTERRTIAMLAWVERSADRSVPKVKGLHDTIFDVNRSAALWNAASVDTLDSSIYSIEKYVDFKPNNIFGCSETSERSNTLFSVCDVSTVMGILGECPGVSSLVSNSGREEYKTICTVQKKVAESIQALFEQVSDEPTVSSKYYKNFTATGNDDSLCKIEYQMEAISSGIHPEEKFPDVKVASESTKTNAASCQGTLWSRKQFDHGTKEDDEYETSENIKHTTPVPNDKVSKNVNSLTLEDEEQKEGNRISDNDYADVDL